MKIQLLSWLILALLVVQPCSSQDIDLKNYRMIYNFNTIKQKDNSRLLDVHYSARNKKDRKDRIPIYDAKIKFVNYLGDEEIMLGEKLTSEEGYAKLVLPGNQKYLVDSEGYINIRAQFEGSEHLKPVKRDVRIKDLHLQLTLNTIDSLRSIHLKAYTIDSIGKVIPVEDLTVNLGVKSMLAIMPVADAQIENGEYTMTYMDDIPGDANGNITFHSFLDDHYEYGTVEIEKSIQWGESKENLSEDHKLWTKAAPYWMYVVLTIMLVGVWANYGYSIYNLFKMKKEGEKPEYN